MQKRIVCITVINEHSVLARVSGLFAGRGYNIESLTVAPLPDGNLSRITISTKGDERVLEQIIKQLHKLVPVLSVNESPNIITQEVVLVKFEINDNISKVHSVVDLIGGKMVSINEKYIIFSIIQETYKIRDIINALSVLSPKEIIRSGVIALEK